MYFENWAFKMVQHASFVNYESLRRLGLSTSTVVLFISNELLLNTLLNCLVLFQCHVFHPITNFSEVEPWRENMKRGGKGKFSNYYFSLFSPFGFKSKKTSSSFLFKNFSNQNDFHVYLNSDGRMNSLSNVVYQWMVFFITELLLHHENRKYYDEISDEWLP